MNSRPKIEKNVQKGNLLKQQYMYFEILLSLQKIRDKVKCVRYPKDNKTHPKSCHSPRSVVDNLYFPLLALDESTR